MTGEEKTGTALEEKNRETGMKKPGRLWISDGGTILCGTWKTRQVQFEDPGLQSLLLLLRRRQLADFYVAEFDVAVGVAFGAVGLQADDAFLQQLFGGFGVGEVDDVFAVEVYLDVRAAGVDKVTSTFFKMTRQEDKKGKDKR